MQRIPAFRVALKDRPKIFQYIVFILVTFSVLNTIFNAVVLIQKEIEVSQRTNNFSHNQDQNPNGITYNAVYRR